MLDEEAVLGRAEVVTHAAAPDRGVVPALLGQ